VRALEVGAGTGKATVAFAARGVEIVALEPSEAMAAVARRNCEPFPNVRIELSTFEDWHPEPDAYDLLFSAQAWHWVSPEVRYRKASDMLVAGGTLALFWHRTRWQGEDLFGELEDVYSRLAPELLARNPGFPGLTPPAGDDEIVAEILASGMFEEPSLCSHPWAATFSANAFVNLLLTQSDHRLLDDGTRGVLIGAIREVVTSHGGEITVPHRTFLVLMRTR
jgi:SAM-dependent methyltransferase